MKGQTAMLGNVALVQMNSIVQLLVDDNKLDAEQLKQLAAIDKLYRDGGATADETADAIAKLVLPIVSANGNGPEPSKDVAA